MRRLTYVLAAPLLITALSAPALIGYQKKKSKPLSATEVFKRSAPGIVAIDCLGPNPSIASGVIVSESGKILTNYHVIQSCQSLVVRLTSGERYDTTFVIETDSRRDLALIRVKAPPLKPLPIGESSEVEVGQTVYSIGNAKGFQNTLQQGLVSAFRDRNGSQMLQVSASINFGNSGGPILDDQARVIALAEGKVADAENLGFAVPIDYAKGLLDSKTEQPYAEFAAAQKDAAQKVAALLSKLAPPTGRGVATAPAVTPGPVSFTKIETIAGRPWKFEAEGLPARQVAFGHLHGVAADRAGNLYVSDISSQAIVKIDSSGRAHVLAGPDSPPRDRPIRPQAVAVDAAGVVYFAEDGQRVRKILPNGQIVTVAGGDRRGFTPDGAPAAGALLSGISGVAVAPDGTVVFTEWDNNRVRRVDANGALQTVAGGPVGFGGDGGPGAQAAIRRPNGAVVDAEGNVFFADTNNGRVRKVSRDGIITTVAGGGVRGESLGCPMGVALSAGDVVYVADPCRRRVFAVRDGSMSVFAGNGSARNEPSGEGGPATAASFDEWALAVDAGGNVLISGPDYGFVYKVASDGRFSTVAGAGNWRAPVDGMPARDAYLQGGRLHLAADRSGGIVVSDADANRLYRIDGRGVITRLTGSARVAYDGENTVAHDSNIDRPIGVSVKPNGAVVFAERGNNNRIREVTPDGKLHTIAGNGRHDYAGDGGHAVDAGMDGPCGLAIDPKGVVYFSDTGHHRIRKITPDGMIQLVAGNGTKGFAGDGGPAERASLDSPGGLEMGPDGSLYIADTGNRRIRRVMPSGVITTVAGDGVDRSAGDGGLPAKASFSWPYGLAFGPDRALYILDQRGGNRIRRIDLAALKITTVAGNGQPGISGDGGDPLQAGLGGAEGFAIDASGNIYIGDAANGVVRMIHAAPYTVRSASAPGGAPGGVVGGVPGGLSGGAQGGVLGGIISTPPPPPPPPVRVAAIQVSVDRMETLLRGKIGVWTEEDAKTILGAVSEQHRDAQGDVVAFNTPATSFASVSLHFAATGKLASADFKPAQSLRWEAQLAYMKTKFPGDDFRIEQRGENVSYTFPGSRTAFVVQPSGNVASMSIF